MVTSHFYGGFFIFLTLQSHTFDKPTINLLKQDYILMYKLSIIIYCMLQLHPVAEHNRAITKAGRVFSRENLVAWCIVPYDTTKRTPALRAKMLNKLGITKFAYDWREEHIASAGDEMDTMGQHHIKLQGFWMPYGPNPSFNKHYNDIMEQLEKRAIKTQLWWSYGSSDEGLKNKSQDEKIKYVGDMVKIMAARASGIGCTVGLYNHNGWFGEPENMLAILAYVNMKNVGIVYNFNHAEDQVDRFPEFFPKILPHLIALNIAGLKNGKPGKIVPVGQGDSEQEMIRIIAESSYNGPVGIINEDTHPDAETGLTMNMDGLKKILQSLGYTGALNTYK
ncbi:MAG TPA: TIM barrel protein [Chitinophagaceae bacterium]|nr:TIM barrel protein [Chitinophagaceae bacterium]